MPDNNISDISNGIGVHHFPFLNDTRPEAKRRLRQWIKFVRVRRKLKKGEWTPSPYSAICSVHFKPQDFQRRYSVLTGMKLVQPRLITDDIGVAAIPTIQPAVVVKTSPRKAKRSRRLVSTYNNIHYIEQHYLSGNHSFTVENNSSSETFCL